MINIAQTFTYKKQHSPCIYERIEINCRYNKELNIERCDIFYNLSNLPFDSLGPFFQDEAVEPQYRPLFQSSRTKPTKYVPLLIVEHLSMSLIR